KRHKFSLLSFSVVEIVVPCSRIDTGKLIDIDTGDRLADGIIDVVHEIAQSGKGQQPGTGNRQVDRGGPRKVLVLDVPGDDHEFSAIASDQSRRIDRKRCKARYAGQGLVGQLVSYLVRIVGSVHVYPSLEQVDGQTRFEIPVRFPVKIGIGQVLGR